MPSKLPLPLFYGDMWNNSITDITSITTDTNGNILFGGYGSYYEQMFD